MFIFFCDMFFALGMTLLKKTQKLFKQKHDNAQYAGQEFLI